MVYANALPKWFVDCDFFVDNHYSDLTLLRTYTLQTDSLIERNEENSVLDSIFSLQCLQSCLQVGRPPFRNTNVTSCSKTLCVSVNISSD